MASLPRTPALTYFPGLPLANLITTLRIVLLVVFTAAIYKFEPRWVYSNVVLLVLIFTSDALDGYVARARNETSEFGAVYDIAADRIVELSLWIVFFDLNYVPLWVVLLFVVRGGLVDAIRNTRMAEQRQTPYSIMTSQLGKWLVTSKFMRGFYAAVKAVTFCWLALLEAFKVTAPELAVEPYLLSIAMVLILTSTLLCVVRGLPVIVEYVASVRRG